MDSFDHCVNDSSFFIFLNESYIYLAENMHSIPISNGSVLRFSLGCPKQTKSAERSKNGPSYNFKTILHWAFYS